MGQILLRSLSVMFLWCCAENFLWAPPRPQRPQEGNLLPLCPRCAVGDGQKTIMWQTKNADGKSVFGRWKPFTRTYTPAYKDPLTHVPCCVQHIVCSKHDVQATGTFMYDPQALTSVKALQKIIFPPYAGNIPPALFACSTVKEIDLPFSACWGDPGSADQIVWPHLKKLWNLRPDGKQNLATLLKTDGTSAVPNLQVLHAYGRKGDIWGALPVIATIAPQLRHLDMTNVVLEALNTSVLYEHPTLSHVFLSFPQDGGVTFASMPALERLQMYLRMFPENPAAEGAWEQAPVNQIITLQGMHQLQRVAFCLGNKKMGDKWPKETLRTYKGLWQAYAEGKQHFPGIKVQISQTMRPVTQLYLPPWRQPGYCPIASLICTWAFMINGWRTHVLHHLKNQKQLTLHQWAMGLLLLQHPRRCALP